MYFIYFIVFLCYTIKGNTPRLQLTTINTLVEFLIYSSASLPANKRRLFLNLMEYKKGWSALKTLGGNN